MRGCNAKRDTSYIAAVRRKQSNAKLSRYHRQQRNTRFLAVSFFSPTFTRRYGVASPRHRVLVVGGSFVNKRAGRPGHVRAETGRADAPGCCWRTESREKLEMYIYVLVYTWRFFISLGETKLLVKSITSQRPGWCCPVLWHTTACLWLCVFLFFVIAQYCS